MLEHVGGLHDLYDLTRRWYTYLRGRVYSFIVRRCGVRIETPDRTLLKFSAEGEDHLSLMALSDPIDISSSDSESERELEKENESSLIPVASGISRKLPSWGSTISTKPNGYNGLSRNRQLSERGLSSDERLTNFNHPLEYNSQKQLSAMYGDRAPDQYMNRTYDPNVSTAKGNVGQSVNGLRIEDLDSRTNSSYTGMHGDVNGKFSSQQSLRRTLPPTLQPSASTAKAKASMDNGSSSKISDIQSKPHQSLGSNTVHHKGHTINNSGVKDNDEIFMYERNGSRLLPPSLMHGKHLPSSQSAAGPILSRSHSAGPSDPPAYYPGVEGTTENDERLIYQAVLQNLSQPKIEVDVPHNLLTVRLLKHQKLALGWLYQKETKSVHCLGGILADDQGLGKTVSMIALILFQRYLDSMSAADDLRTVKTEALNLDDDDDKCISEAERVKQTEEFDEVKAIPKVRGAVPPLHKGRPAAGTLVVCPASVLRQWARELDDKVTESSKLSVLIYHGGTRTKDPLELAKYDVVLTTYAIVANEVPKQRLADDDDEDKNDEEKYGLSSEFTNNKKRKKAHNASKRGKKGRNGMHIDCGSGTLAKVGWLRVILDEAQTIKNHRTQVARACCGLRAKRRWCLSGTPIQNTIDDLFSYFRFLKYDPYAVYKCFCLSIKNAISRDASHGYKKLQAVLQTIMLRRTKGTLLDGEPIINLPPKSICLVKVEFTIEERDFYSKLEADSRTQFKEYAAAGTLNQNYANILLMLLRLRQACDHPLLVKGQNADFVGKASIEMARRLPKDMLMNLLNLLEDPICSLCSDPPEQAVVTMCGHVFCYQCVSEYLTGDDNLCPAHECKEQLGTDVVFAKATLRNCVFGDFHDNGTTSLESIDKPLALQNIYTSSKIRAVLEILEKNCKSKNICNKNLALEDGKTYPSEGRYLEYGNSNVCAASTSSLAERPVNSIVCDAATSSLAERPVNSIVCDAATSSLDERPVKTIVFSQWTGMLDLVETALNHSCIQYRRFDGTMSLASRDRAVKDFNNDPEVAVMLMSLKAGNLGLNLIAACHVILLDLWWNPTTEDQAIDRAHRIGQTRPVTVSRLTVSQTVEDRILTLQEEKRKMVASAFGEDHKGGTGTRLTAEDLRYLFMV